MLAVGDPVQVQQHLDAGSSRDGSQVFGSWR
jgi:hypothetical protein